MKRLIKQSGMAINKMNRMFPGETATVYHGTSAGYVDAIKQEGLTVKTENSAQSSGNSYGAGIWVSLNKDTVVQYAIDSSKKYDETYTDQFNGQGAIISFEVPKEWLTDEGSASNNNLKSTQPIPGNLIKDIEYIPTGNSKSAQLFKGFKNFSGKYYEIFKNPTYKEADDIRSQYDGARMIITSNGDLYVWSCDILHDYAVNDFKVPDGVHITEAKSGSLEIYIPEHIDIYKFKDYFNSASSNLSNIGINAPTKINHIDTDYYGAPSHTKYYEISTLGDIYNLEIDKSIVDDEHVAKTAGNFDIGGRDAAICYIDGEVIEAETHAECIDDYLRKHFNVKLNDHFARPLINDDMETMRGRDKDDVMLIKEHIKSIAFAHRVDDENGIFIEEYSLYNIDMNTVATAMSQEYRGYKIYNDDTYNYETRRWTRVAGKAHDWVSERAELLLKKNPEMEEGMAYGIAWKQYKKDHPKWKSKFEKKKKKVSRLAKVAAYWSNDELTNWQDKNEEYYQNIKDQIDYIEQSFEQIDSCDFYDDFAKVTDEMDNISSYAQIIFDNADNAKDIGIQNENELSKGRDAIDKLEDQLNSLQDELDQLGDEVYDLDDEINFIENKIQDIQNQIDSMEETAGTKSRLVKNSKRHGFICHAHDEIMSEANIIIEKTDKYHEDFENKYNDISDEASQSENKDSIIESKYVELKSIIYDFTNEVNNCISTIQDDLNQAYEMNNRMGTGIDRKNERIVELTEAIGALENEISNNRDNKAGLENTLSDLKSTLQQLENQL